MRNTIEVNNRNTKKRREICSKLTIKTSERRHLGMRACAQRLKTSSNIYHMYRIYYFTLKKRNKSYTYESCQIYENSKVN